jgi:branched-chain amino acid transport system substrate-binding protein
MAMIRSVVALLGLLLIAVPHVRAQEPIRIGFMYVFSGRLAHYGHGAKQGAELAISRINKAGGVNSRKLVGIYEDTMLKPEVGVKAAEKLVHQDKVDVLMGIVSSGVASAVAPVANRLKTPLIITLAMTPDVTGTKCNPYTFRVSVNGPQNILGAATLAASTKVKKWTTIGPDYLFGYQCWDYFQKYLRSRNSGVNFAPEDQTAFAPVAATDFSAYIDKIMQSDADGILVSLYGGNLVDFIRQGTQKKLFDGSRVFLMNLAYSADVMLGLGLDMPKGMWLGGLYWYQANNSAVNKQFIDDYRSLYRVFPDYNAHGAYAGVLAYCAALAQAGTTEPSAVIKALEGLKLDLPVGQVEIRQQDHQVVCDVVWGVTDEFDGKSRIRSLKPLKIFPGNEVTPAPEETECRMQKTERFRQRPHNSGIGVAHRGDIN